MKDRKYPGHLHTVEINFGPDVPMFFDHYSSPDIAQAILRNLVAKMNKSAGQIAFIRHWHKGKIISSHTAKPPPVVWQPLPDPDGVKRYPERGKRAKPPPRPHVPGTRPSMKI